MRCKKCIVPQQVPGVSFDEQGVCNWCRSYRAPDEAAVRTLQASRETDLESAFEAAKSLKRPYDALVCLSGGKDSLYLLHRAKVDFGLKVLAFTVNNNIPAVAWSSIQRTIQKLNVDHLVYRPSEEFYRKLFRHLLTHQESRGAVYTVSYVYAPLFEGDALEVATTRGIPLVLAGYSPGQPDPNRMEYEFSRRLICETDWTPPGLRNSGAFTDAELGRFWNPGRFPAGTNFPRYIAPFHAWSYDQEQIMRLVTENGYVARKSHADPVNSNYPINWLLMYSDIKHFGYNPYAPEFAALIREGKASRFRWSIMAPLVDWMIRRRVLLGAETNRQLKLLGLQESELRINQPTGAYDPPGVAHH